MSILIHQASDVERARLLSLRAALRLEVLGMRHSGRISAYRILKDEHALTGGKAHVLAQIDLIIAQPPLSCWQTGSSLPSVDGVYQRRLGSSTHYALFKKGTWRQCCPSAYEASKGHQPSAFQSLDWRGLSREQHA